MLCAVNYRGRQGVLQQIGRKKDTPDGFVSFLHQTPQHKGSTLQQPPEFSHEAAPLQEALSATRQPSKRNQRSTMQSQAADSERENLTEIKEVSAIQSPDSDITPPPD